MKQRIGRWAAVRSARRAIARASLVACVFAAAAAADIAPDDAIRPALAALAGAASEADARRLLDELADRVRRDPAGGVAQLIGYVAVNENDPAARARVGRVLQRLDLPKDALVRALVPHLDDRSPAVVRQAREMLKHFEDASADRPPDFSTYRAIIEDDVRAGREPRSSLVRHIYATDPGTALRVMVRACQLREPDEIKPILWAEHVVADLHWKRRFGFADRRATDPAVVHELDRLSRHDRSWVRLYAAEIVRAHPELSNAELSRRLAADANALVREAARPPPAPSVER